MRPTTEPGARDWINGRQAARLLGTSPTAIVRVAMLGQVRVQLTPGVSPRYNRSDVEKLALVRARPQTLTAKAMPRAKRKKSPGATKAGASEACAQS
jgi:hypothetical protein